MPNPFISLLRTQPLNTVKQLGSRARFRLDEEGEDPGADMGVSGIVERKDERSVARRLIRRRHYLYVYV